LMTTLTCQSLNDVEILTWKILMNEQNSHQYLELLK